MLHCAIIADMKNKGQQKILLKLDEMFKTYIKNVLKDDAEVITDFEILKRPPKADIVIIKPIEGFNKKFPIFEHFKKINIIEFKSADDRFKVPEDIYQIEIYIGGVLKNMPQYMPADATFTVVCTVIPKKFLEYSKMHLKIIRKGIYFISGISLVPITLIVAANTFRRLCL